MALRAAALVDVRARWLSQRPRWLSQHSRWLCELVLDVRFRAALARRRATTRTRGRAPLARARVSSRRRRPPPPPRTSPRFDATRPTRRTSPASYERAPTTARARRAALAERDERAPTVSPSEPSAPPSAPPFGTTLGTLYSCRDGATDPRGVGGAGGRPAGRRGGVVVRRRRAGEPFVSPKIAVQLFVAPGVVVSSDPDLDAMRETKKRGGVPTCSFSLAECDDGDVADVFFSGGASSRVEWWSRCVLARRRFGFEPERSRARDVPRFVNARARVAAALFPERDVPPRRRASARRRAAARRVSRRGAGNLAAAAAPESRWQLAGRRSRRTRRRCGLWWDGTITAGCRAGLPRDDAAGHEGLPLKETTMHEDTRDEDETRCTRTRDGRGLDDDARGSRRLRETTRRRRFRAASISRNNFRLDGAADGVRRGVVGRRRGERDGERARPRAAAGPNGDGTARGIETGARRRGADVRDDAESNRRRIKKQTRSVPRSGPRSGPRSVSRPRRSGRALVVARRFARRLVVAR